MSKTEFTFRKNHYDIYSLGWLMPISKRYKVVMNHKQTLYFSKDEIHPVLIEEKFKKLK